MVHLDGRFAHPRYRLRRSVPLGYPPSGLGPPRDDECHGFARVVKFDGDAVMGFALLKELTGDEGEKVAEELALTEDDWCDYPDE